MTQIKKWHNECLKQSHLDGNYSAINITGKKMVLKFYPKNKTIKKNFEEVQFKLNIGDVLFYKKFSS